MQGPPGTVKTRQVPTPCAAPSEGTVRRTVGRGTRSDERRIRLHPLPFVDNGAGVVFAIAVGLFAVLQLTSSIVSTVRSGRSTARHVRLDRWSLPYVILCAGLGVFGAATTATHLPQADIAPGSPSVRWVLFGLGIAVVVTGSALRLWAITTLGRWFTYDVRVTEGQPVVQAGPYRWVRHPSYTGILLVLLGIGLTLGNWLSLALIVVLPTAGLVRRIRVEEAALLGTIGEPYARYAAGRFRLVPRLW
jgi:protein-S-isoprenylcysteine O-methyltransferase Ste14